MPVGVRRMGAKGASRGVAVVVVSGLVWLLSGSFSTAQTTSALRVEASGPAQRVQGSDGREHIEYDLIVSAAFTAEATLKSLEVLAGGRRLLSLSGSALAASTLASGTSAPTGGRVGSGSTVVVQVDI